MRRGDLLPDRIQGRGAFDAVRGPALHRQRLVRVPVILNLKERVSQELLEDRGVVHGPSTVDKERRGNLVLSKDRNERRIVAHDAAATRIKGEADSVRTQRRRSGRPVTYARREHAPVSGNAPAKLQAGCAQGPNGWGQG